MCLGGIEDYNLSFMMSRTKVSVAKQTCINVIIVKANIFGAFVVNQ